MKRSPLQRRTPLKRGGRLRPVSARGKQKQAEMADARPIVMSSSGGRCEACDKHVLAECDGVATDAHHVRRASQGGVNHPANLLAVSRFHHQHIHNNPKESMLFGLLKGNNND